jgi:hypothetical protein
MHGLMPALGGVLHRHDDRHRHDPTWQREQRASMEQPHPESHRPTVYGAEGRWRNPGRPV